MTNAKAMSTGCPIYYETAVLSGHTLGIYIFSLVFIGACEPGIKCMFVPLFPWSIACHIMQTHTHDTHQTKVPRERVRKRDMQIGQRIVEIVALFPACRFGVFAAPIIEPVSHTHKKPTRYEHTMHSTQTHTKIACM